MTDTAYFLGLTDNERDRLAAQAASFEPSARRLLDRIGVPSGASVVDLGCGPYGILDLLSEKVGPAGSVIGLEPAPQFAHAAEKAVSERALGNVTIINADISGSGLQPGRLDLVHERLVLIQAPNPAGVLRDAVSLVRPGGVFAAQEVDLHSWLCHPNHPSWDALLEAFMAVASGVSDPYMGRRLPEMLRAQGLEEVRMEVDVRAYQPGEYHRGHLLALVDSVRSALSEQFPSDADIDTHLDNVRTHLADPNTLVIGPTLVQAWGRVPGPR